MNKNTIKKIIGTLIVLLCLVAVLLIILQKSHEFKLYREIKKDSYTSVFLSDFDTKNYKKEVFDLYIGGNNLVYFEDNMFSLGNELKYITKHYDFDAVRIGLNPFEVDYEFLAGNKLGRIINSSFYNSVKENPDVSFQIILYSPNGNMWKTQKDINKKIKSYEMLVNSLEAYDNVTVYFPGYEEWVIDNRLLYSDETFGKSIEEEWIPMTFCDGLYVIDSQNQWDKYNELIANCTNGKDEYPNMNEVEFVFFGDSIIGNYTGVSSIPGDVRALTGADVLNLGVGGTKAGIDFEAAVYDYFENAEISDKNKIYVINYGLNDFFDGISPEDNGGISYEAGLKKGIEIIKANDASGLIVIAAPNYSECCQNGEGTVTPNAPVIGRYIDVASKVSEDYDAVFINMYTELNIDISNYGDYLLDGIHLNGNARMRYSKILLDRLVEK